MGKGSLERMNYYQYIKSKEWEETKKYFAQIKEKNCFCCGTDKYLNLHHRHYKTVGYEDGSELAWLCRAHHKEVHFYYGSKMIPDTDENIKTCDHVMRLIRHKILGTPKYHHTNKERKAHKLKIKMDKAQRELIRMAKKRALTNLRDQNHEFNMLKIERLGLKIPETLKGKYGF